MYKIKNLLIPTLVLIALQLSSSVAVVRAQLSQDQLLNKLAQIDVQLNNADDRMKQIQGAQKDISRFSAEAVSWFNRVAAKETAIRSLKKEKEGQHYANAKNKIQEKIDLHMRDRHNLLNLNGTVVKSYFGFSCTTTAELRNEFNRTGEEAGRLNKKKKQLAEQLKSTNIRRDQLASELEAIGGGTQKRIEGYERNLKSQQETYQFLQKLANDPKTWCVLDPYHQFPEPIYIDREIMMNNIALGYINHIKKSGEKFDPAELVSLVTTARDNSKLVKDIIIKKTLPELSQSIENLQYQIKTSKTPVFELAGCWMLTVGKSTSQFQVTQDANNRYHGILVVNNLKYYQNGQEIFVVNRQSPNTFSGMENSFNNTGQPRVNQLQITVHSNGNFLTYNSDSTITMHRCQ